MHDDERAWLECSCRISDDDAQWTGDTEAEHAAHVAEELAKAGYGNVHAEVKRVRTDNEHIKPGAGAYSSGFHYALDAVAGTPDPLAAALADPDGHTLVKATHDRKAEV